MANRNVRVDERFEVSLGGVQIASIVVAALIVLAAVFFLGVHAGERVGMRRAETVRPANLPELDAVAPAPSQKPVPPGELTYAAELPRAKPPTAPPPAPPKPPKPAEARTTESRPAEPVATAPTPSALTSARPERSAAAGGAESKGAGGAESKGEPPKPASPSWTVQLGASQNRAEAEELARKLSRLGARIEEADIPGKGHYFRVRLGRFADRSAAEKYKADVARETGLAGVLVPPGG